MYFAVTDHVVSSVLLRHQEGIQRPVYYLNKTLVDVETWYFPLEKNGNSVGTCYKEAITLFSSPYDMGANRVPPTVTFEKVKFH